MQRIMTRHPGLFILGSVLALLALLICTLTWWGPGLSQHHEKRIRRWSPEPWGLTARDFPGRDATEIPMDKEWMRFTGSIPNPGPDIVHPPSLPALRWLLLDNTSVGYLSQLDPDGAGTYATSGVLVDGVQVFSLVMAIDGERFDTARADAMRELQHDAQRLTPAHTPGQDGYVSGEYLGERTTYTKMVRLNIEDAPFELGKPGHFGTRVVEAEDESGKRRLTTAVATVVEGAFVAVGTVVPAEAAPAPAPAPDLTAPSLLEQLADEVRAHPPT